MVKQLFVETKGQGLYEITAQVRRLVEIDAFFLHAIANGFENCE